MFSFFHRVTLRKYASSCGVMLSKQLSTRCSSTTTNNFFQQLYKKNKPLLSAIVVLSLPLILGVASIEESKCFDAEHGSHHREPIVLTRNFVADVVESVSPAVVNILCANNNSYYGMSASSGSGFIIDRNGYIVTNAHVVAPAGDGKVIVTMKSGKKRSATVHSMDVLSDIAIVRLDDVHDEILPVVPFGASSKIRSGEFVIAIGSPMHLQNSASLGIVSATARHASELGISNNRSEYIQTDAAINMGNSGGPLVNLDGEVIGINTMKVKDTDGISFAIPIDIASQIIKQLLYNKRVVRPYVGLKMANMVAAPKEYSTNKDYRRRHPYPSNMLSTEDTKVVVLDVVRGSPAYLAGLHR